MYNEVSSGWQKYGKGPVLGGELGTCFDLSVLKDGDMYRMYFSWRPKQSIAMTQSKDGIHWTEPVIVLSPREATGWEEEVNRPVVLKRDGRYFMWYTGQRKPGAADGNSWIGYARSIDGIHWGRQDEPVMGFEEPWEKNAVMCPHVIWDENEKVYRMWYSGGEQYEPDAIGYATSPDGARWIKYGSNPVFFADSGRRWEQEKVTACQVVQCGGWHLMFYIGFEDIHTARIGVARSRDGVSGWERLRTNPIISPGIDKWDADACYKPYAIFDYNRWLLWYNGRRGSMEQIGMAIHEGIDLGF